MTDETIPGTIVATIEDAEVPDDDLVRTDLHTDLEEFLATHLQQYDGPDSVDLENVTVAVDIRPFE